MQKLTLKMLQDLFLKAVREDKVTGDKSGIVRDAYQLKLSQAALDTIKEDPNFFGSQMYPDTVNKYDNEVGTIGNMRLCLDDSLGEKFILGNGAEVHYEGYLLENNNDIC